MNQTLKLIALICSVVLLSPFSLTAEEVMGPSTVQKVDLNQFIETLRYRNPDLIAARADWLAAKKRVWVDSSLPDPMGGLDLMGPMTETRVGPQENRFMVSQELPLPPKLWEKGKIAHEEAQAVFQRYRAVERDRLNELNKLYYELYYVDASIEVIEEVKNILNKFEGVAQSRFANRSGSQRDVAKAQAEVSMSLEKLYRLRQQRESVAAKINALLDQDPMTVIGSASAPEKPVLEHSLMGLINLAVANRQEIKEMEAMVKKSTHEKRLSKWNFLPDVNVGFEYTQVGNGMTSDPDDGRDSWMFPIRFTLPIWMNKNIPAAQEAQKKLEANRARLLAAKNTTFYEVKDAYYRLDSALKMVELYDIAVIPQAELALNSDQAGYQGGSMDFLNLLDSERVFLNAKLAYIRFLVEAHHSYSDLIRSTGIDLTSSVAPVHDEGVVS